MRKLKLQVQMTIDGFIAGPNGEMDWLTFNWSDDIKKYVSRLTDEVDTILLGKNLAHGFIPHWTDSYNSDEPLEGAEVFVKTPKIVFSKTMEHSIWDNTIVVQGDLSVEINALKSQEGGDMIVYGGGQFVSALISEGLIDELHLFINPVILGDGMTIFREVKQKQNYHLISTTPFECGIVVLEYRLPA